MITLLLLATAHAGEPRLEVPVVQRGLVIGRLNVMLGVEAGLLRNPSDTGPVFVLPMRVGLTKNFELFASPVLQPTTDPLLHEPALGATYRFKDGPLEIGVTAFGDLAIFQPVKNVTLVAGIPVRLHLAGIVAVDAALLGQFTVSPDTFGGFRIPVGVTLNVTDSVFVGAHSGVAIADLGHASDNTRLPFGVRVGYTIPHDDKPLLDLVVHGTWDDVQASDAFTVGVSAKLYLFP